MKSRNLTYSGRGLASLNTKVSKPNLEVEVQDILGKGSGGIVYKGGIPVSLFHPSLKCISNVLAAYSTTHILRSRTRTHTHTHTIGATV